MKRVISWLYNNFKQPLLVLLGILLYLGLFLIHQDILALLVILASIAVGSIDLLKETFSSLIRRQYALDYIAILAILVAVVTNEYLVAAVIALMLSSGRTLEQYGVQQARRSLTALVNRIPDEILLVAEGKPGEKEKIGNVRRGQHILIRKGEVIPLDGVLLSNEALIDESSLTGEPYVSEKHTHDLIRSGTVNQGDPIAISVTNEEKDSTYKKIIAMVEKAEEEKPPLVRLADKYSAIFTLVTFVIAGFAFWASGGSIERVLAVLVVATPCPLILATPIALMGGVNKAAKQRIIIKEFAALEVLNRVNSLVFDKTGTITLGKPILERIEIHEKKITEKSILSIAAAIERNSLHPLAKAVVEKARTERAPIATATHITEHIGIGIQAIVEGETFLLKKIDESDRGMAIGVYRNKRLLATLSFEDEIKQDSQAVLAKLHAEGLDLHIFTGDKKAAAEKVAATLKTTVSVHAGMSPMDKQEGIQALKKQNRTVGMVGDGINDAPALALADVGLVFSNEEQTAASEAADIVLLGGDFALVANTIAISKRTIAVAMQSILWGIGLSIAAMVFASLGIIPPIVGAGLQEAIDVAVILNALRASK